MPYRIVLNKLRVGTPRLVESLPAVVRNVVGALFPPGVGDPGLDSSLGVGRSSGSDWGDLFDRLGVKIGKAPSPDGITG